jgi:hypothetical protein
VQALFGRDHTHGDWETRLGFFLTGVKETAQQASLGAMQIREPNICENSVPSKQSDEP